MVYLSTFNTWLIFGVHAFFCAKGQYISEPLWAAGSNRYGTLGISTTSNTNPRPLEIPLLNGSTRIIAVAVSESSVFVQTTQSTTECELDHRAADCKVWAWGSNAHGKLGSNALQGGPVPALLPRSSFPNVYQAEYGNEIGGNLSNNVLSYEVWTGAGITSFKLFLSNGTKGLLRIAAEISEGIALNGHDRNVVLITSNVKTERATLKLTRPGYRLILSQGLANVLGFYSSKFPAIGVVNEVSDRMQNNVIIYRVWVPTQSFNLLHSFFYFRAWSYAKQAADRFQIQIPDGLYSLSSLVSLLNREVSNMQATQALNLQSFDFGGGDIAVSTLYDAGIIVEFDLPNGVGEFMGFPREKFPPNTTFGGVGVPNEISTAADTGIFQYRTQSGIFNVTFPAGIYSVDQVQNMIEFGLSKNGHDPRAFNFVVGQDDRVVLLILRPGYQAVFDTVNNVGQYLGFFHMDVPCNPAHIVPNLTEDLIGSDRSAIKRPFCISHFSSPNASMTVQCKNSSRALAGLMCGLSVSGTYMKRGYHVRPLLTNFSASGICRFFNGSSSTAVCGCSANGTLRVCVSLDESSWSLEGLNTGIDSTYNVSSCICTKKSFSWQKTATRKWGIVAQRSVILPDGVYSHTSTGVAGSPTRDLLSEISAGITTDLQHNNISGQISVSALLMSSSIQYSFRVYGSETTVGIQLLFSTSSVSSVLGLRGNTTLPFDHFMTQNDEPTQDGNFLNVLVDTTLPYFSNTHSEEANVTGEWVYKIAAGRLHTVVLTKHPNNARFCSGNVNVGSGCGCFRTRLWSFGSNKFGQLGTSENIGTDEDNPDPILIHFTNSFRPECIVSVYAGGYHTAVLEQLSGGSNVWMFGSNSFGQVGRQPSIMEPACCISPLIFGVNNFLGNFSMFLGLYHTVLLQSARVWVFGKPFNDSDFTMNIDLSVPSAANFTWISGCTGNSFVVLQGSDRSLWSFGDNLYGQLGQSNYYTAPFQLYMVGENIMNLSQGMVSTFACGGDHVVVVTADGTVWTFGKNLYGQLMRDANIGLNNQNFQPSAVDPSLFSSNAGVLFTPVINVWAAGDFSFAQTGRMMCGAGFKSSDGLQPCTPCSAGTFSVANRSTFCDSCVYGKYSLLGASVCVHCPFGTYSNVQKSSVCSSCPAGRNGTRGTASISVDNCTVVCPAGQYGVFGVVPCTPCSRGNFAAAAASSLCQPCPMGQYQSSVNQTFCFQCSQNKSTSESGSTESTACLSICTVGYFGVNGLANCSACPPGKYAESSRSSSCQNCPIDTFGNRSGLSFCYECPYKTGTNSTGHSKNSSCLAWCLPGQYSSNGLATCSNCSAGNISRMFRSIACITCAEAAYPCDSSSDCCACPSGTYLNSYLKSNGTFSCQSCLPGSYSDLNHSTVCLLCGRGTFSSSFASTSCIFCSSLFNTSTYGTVSIGSTNASACQNLCPEGYFSGTGLPPCKTCDPGSVSYSGALSCISCFSGKYSSSASANCLLCKNGSYSFDNSSQCTFCPAGSISAPSNSGCSLCAPGTYASAAGQSVCADCDANDFSSGYGASMCIACSPGKYQNGTGQSLCNDCSPGTFNNPVEDGPGCVDCSPGSYQNIPGQTACTLCAAGSFTTENRSRACWNCGAGHFQDLEGQTSCKSCEAGTYSFDNMSQCLSCSFGSFSNASASICANCPEGFNTSMIGSAGVSHCRRVCIAGEFGHSFGIANESGGCEFCSAGTYSFASYSTSCTDCSLGTFSSANMSSCKVCESGTFSSVLGSTKCNPCTQGYFQDQTGYSVCFPCLAGTFSAINQSIRCENCSEGLFTFKLGSTGCSRCIPGKYAVESGCRNCSSGQISDGLGSCTSCPAGTFSNQEAGSVCISCAGGKSTAHDNSNSSNDCVPVCPPGFFGSMLGVNATYDRCRVCAIGTYNRFRHQSACRVCPAGTFSNLSGSTSCSSCPLGFFTNKENQTSCSQCPNTAFPFNQATETLKVGSSDVADCITLEYGACESSPRHFGVYPVYTIGRNEYGESIGDSFYSNTPDSAKSIHPYLITCDQLGYSEIYMFETSGDHSLFQTVRKGVNGSKDFMLWSVGKNSHGQLGSKQNAGTNNMNSRPWMVPRALFPNTKCGNAVSKFCKNNMFFYWNWNLQTNTNGFFNLTIDDGVYGPDELVLHVSEKAKDLYGHTQTFFQTEISKESQRVVVLIAVPGFQVDFSLQGSVKDNLGFDFIKVPAQSTLNEISERAGNVFSYRIWCKTLLESPCTSFRTVNTVLPDGIYDLDRLNKEIQVTSMRDGTDLLFAKPETSFPSIDASDSFDISWQLIRFDMVADKVEMSISGAGIQVLFSGPNNVAAFLGFEEINYPPMGPTNASETQYRAHKARGYLNSGQEFEPFKQESSKVGQIVVAFSLGADFTLIQTTDEAANKSRLWGIGSNKHGQLGSYYGAGTDQINWVPILVQAFDQMNGGQEAVMFKAGGSHTLVTDKSGNLWVFGSNEYGQLGMEVNSGTHYANFKPKKLIISDNRPAVNEISAEKGNNCIVIQCSNLSYELNISEGIYSEDDLGDVENQLNDGICRSDLSCDLVKVRFGTTNENKVVFRLISTGEGFCQIHFHNLETAGMFGFVNKTLRPACTKNLGFCDYQADNFSPLFFIGRNRISSISAGQYHSLVLTENSYSGKRILWAWGSNMYGQLGTTAKLCKYADGFYKPCEDGSSYISSPLQLEEFLFLNRNIISFSAGGYHSIVQDSSNALWCFGWNRYGQCGNPLPIIATLELANPVPMLIPSQFHSTGTTQVLNYSRRASKFDGSLTFTLFSTENGLMSVGSNSFGQLIRFTNNLGKENPNFESGKIDAVGTDDQLVLGFVAGSFQSFVQTFRPYCNPGYFSIDGRSPCLICEAGSYAALAGSRNFSSMSLDQSMAHPYFSGTEVMFKHVNITLSCVACPAGTFSKNGSLNCSACGVGEYSFHGASQCHLCPPGTYGREVSASVCGLCEPGKSSLVGQSDCSSCLPGVYASSAGSSSCAQCSIGSFAPSSNTVLCEPCYAGFYQNASGQTMCVVCPESLTTGQKGSKYLDECLALCKAGQEGNSLYSNGPALKNCRDCVKGTYSFNPNTVNGFGATSCLSCGAGKYSQSGASECSNCSAGTFGSKTNASSCILCAAGTYSSQLASSYCKDCIAGLSSIENSSSCAVCPAGSFSAEKSKNCTDCGPGRYSAYDGLPNCLICGAGSYNSISRASSCSVCLGGTFASGWGLSACRVCNPGSVSSSNATTCLECLPGTYAGWFGQSTCSLCEIAKYQSQSNSTACLACPEGKHTQGPLNILDARCLSGPRVCDIPELHLSLDNCVPFCMPGYFSFWGTFPCLECPAGYFNARNASTYCLACSAGTFVSSSAQTVCETCSAGSYSNIHSTTCALCDSGEFQNVDRASMCEKCFYGTYTETGGSSLCTPCPIRMKADDSILYIGVRDCRACYFFSSGAQRKYLDIRDCCDNISTSWLPLNFNFTDSEVNLTNIGIEALEIAANTAIFQLTGDISNLIRLEQDLLGYSVGDSENMSWTLYIQYGGFQIQGWSQSFTQPRRDNITAELVPWDTLLGFDQYEERLTNAYSNQLGLQIVEMSTTAQLFPSSGPSNCTRLEDFPCVRSQLTPVCKVSCFSPYSATALYKPATLSTSRLGTNSSSSCIRRCVKGSVYSESAVSGAINLCKTCSQGYFFDSDPLGSDITCKECDAGTYSPKSAGTLGITACRVCAPGTYSDQNHSSSCKQCTAGTYGEETGISVCTECLSGTFASTIGLTSCILCPAGYFSNATNATVCSSCKDQTYSSIGAALCIQCEPGKVGNGTGQSSCLSCPAGKISVPPSQGDTLDSLSNPGNTSMNNTISGNNSSLEPGLYDDPYQIFLLSCRPCAPGNYSNEGTTACMQCPAGKYSNISEASACNQCPEGSTSEREFGSLRCKFCDAGKYSPGDTSSCIDCSAGYFSYEINSSDCLPCPAGTYNAHNGSSFCSLCTFGEFSTGSAIACESCGVNQNTTSKAQISKLNCKTFCPVGHVGYNGIQPCFPCLAGAFMSRPGARCAVENLAKTVFWNITGVSLVGDDNGSCRLTATNESRLQRAFGCVNCTAGYFQNMSGQSSCAICPYGSYASSGAVLCTECPTGAVTLGKGSSSVLDCLLACKSGYYSLNGQQPCSICHPGKFSLFQYNLNFGSTKCELCPHGTFMPSYGASFCYSCPAGKSTLSTGATNIGTCRGNVAKILCSPLQRASVQVAASYTLFDIVTNSSNEGYFLAKDRPISQSAEVIILDGGTGYVDGDLKIFSGAQEGAHGTFLTKAGRIVSIVLDSESKPDPYIADDRVDLMYRGTTQKMSGSITAIDFNLSEPLIGCEQAEIIAYQDFNGLVHDVLVALVMCNSTSCYARIMVDGEGFADPVRFKIRSSKSNASECRCGSGLMKIQRFSPLVLLNEPYSLSDDLGNSAKNGSAVTNCKTEHCQEVGFDGVCVYNGSHISRIDVLSPGNGFNPFSFPTVNCSFLGEAGLQAFLLQIRIDQALIGESVEDYSNHGLCVHITTAKDAVLSINPLARLHKKFGCEVNSTMACSVTLDQNTLDNERLYAFLMLAIGYTSIELAGSECNSQIMVNLTAGSDNANRNVSGALFCHGQTDLWGNKLNISIIFIEVLVSHETEDFSGKQMHFALSLSGVNHSGSQLWRNLVKHLPILDHSIDSWLGQVNVSASQSAVDLVVFQASSIGFDIIPESIPEHKDLEAQHHVFKRGVALKMIGAGFLAEDRVTASNNHAHFVASPVYLDVDIENETYTINLNESSTVNSFNFFGLERMLPKVAAGSANVTLDGYLDVPGCVWPDSNEMVWVLLIQDSVLIETQDAGHTISHPKGLFGTNSGVVVQIKGLASDPELMLSWSIIGLLEENTAFLMRASCTLQSNQRLRQRFPLTVLGQSTSWFTPFNSKWFRFVNTTYFRIEIVCNPEKELVGCDFVYMNFNASGKRYLSFDCTARHALTLAWLSKSTLLYSQFSPSLTLDALDSPLYAQATKQQPEMIKKIHLVIKAVFINRQNSETGPGQTDAAFQFEMLQNTNSMALHSAVYTLKRLRTQRKICRIHPGFKLLFILVTCVPCQKCC